ncbi:indolethylamine N-methyltransferase-like [Lissotriton helveticus]
MASFAALQAIHDLHLDPKAMLDTYSGENSGFKEDSVKWIFTRLNKTFSLGEVKGETLMLLSIGPYFPYMFPACDYFTEIIISVSTDKGIAEVEKWLKNAPGAIDCSHTAKLTCELQGNRETWVEKQDVLRGKTTKVLKYNVNNCNPLSPTTLPPVDCLFLKHCLECHTTNKKEFCSSLKNVTSQLKSGGHLIFIACLVQTYYVVEGFKFPNLSIEDDFVRTCMLDAGYVIQESELLHRTVDFLHDVADYKGIMYVRAQKK